MSRGRRQVIQINDPPARSLYSNEPTYNEELEQEDDDDDDMGDMPTPERLVTEDMLPAHYSQPVTGEMDNKVANFLAEIDALDEPLEASKSPIAPEPLPIEQAPTPVREKRSPVRSKPNAYSNMFVKGTPEFTKPSKDFQGDLMKPQLEPWPEEPHSDWEQLKDEKTDYPYYWNTKTNAVVWDMPPEFSQFLLRQKEYEEKVERGLREGKLDPRQREQRNSNGQEDVQNKEAENQKAADNRDQRSRSHKKGHRHGYSSSEDSSADSSDSESSHDRDRDRSRRGRKSPPRHANDKAGNIEVTSSNVDKDKASHLAKSSVSPDTTYPDDKKSGSLLDDGKQTSIPDNKVAIGGGVEEIKTGSEVRESKKPLADDNDDSMDFDIDDIDKQLELALEKKRQELMKVEDDKDKKPEKSDKPSTDKDSDKHRHRHSRDDDRHRSKHSKHDREHRDKDRDKRHEKETEKEDKKPKLTLKERLRVEMELKLDKERRKKKAIEEMMARELEKTVGPGAGPPIDRAHKRHSAEEHDKGPGYKRYRHDVGPPGGPGMPARGRGQDYEGYRDGFDAWGKRGGGPYQPYDDRFGGGNSMKPPPPTAEMLAEDRRSQVVDYGHSSGGGRPRDGDSDHDEHRSADAREMEIKKLEALQLAELALSKLEFLEVTKKGLSKLQILLIEMETRHQDWQAGGLTTNHFLVKLREANWQLEQYESSAAPTGWACSWDRDYRRYFYTHKLTGKTQWDYPDPDEIKTEDEKGRQLPSREQKTTESRLSRDKKSQEFEESVLLANAALPPPPPPPAEEHPSVKSLMLMYGSDSEEEDKQKQKPKEVTLVPNELPPLPPEPHHQEKKEKKKKKKKDKSKKKEKAEAGAMVVGPVGPVYPAGPIGQPMPPGDEHLVDPIAQGIPVYGSVGSDQYAMNDKPLEFGTVVEGVPVIAAGPQIAGAPQTHNYTTDPATQTTYDAEAASGSVDHSVAMDIDTGAPEGGDSAHVGPLPVTEEKKKKKREKMGTGSISLKKKHVSSMVMKWQKVKKEVELEERDRAMREAEIRRKLAELE